MRSSLIILVMITIVILPLISNAADPTAYVINSVGESLSKINLNTGEVTDNIVLFGTELNSYANQIVIRDTLAYVAVSGTDEIQIIDLNSETTVSFINTGANSNPFWMAFYDNRDLYVSLLLEDKIAKIDLSDNSIGYFNTGTAPSGVVIYDHKLFVVCSNYDFTNYIANESDVYVYDIGPDTLLETIHIGVNAQYAALDADGRIHVTATGDYFSVFGEVYIIDGDDYSTANSFPVGGSPGQIAIAPDQTAYIAAAGFTQAGYVFSYNALTGEIYHDNGNPLEVDQNCIAVVPYQDTTLFSGSFTDYIQIIDSSGAELNRFAVGSGPVHLDFNYLPGDINGDFEVNIIDIIDYIDYKFNGGPDLPYPRWRGNVNGDYSYNVLDIISLIDYKYKGGPRPMIGPPWLDPF